MSKRGRKQLGSEAPIVCWLLVELERDLKGSKRRRSRREACQRIARRFASYGAVEPNRDGPIAWETVRRQYKTANGLLKSPAGRKEAERALGEIRQRRIRLGWKVEPAALLGIENTDLAELWSGALAFAPSLELAAIRSGLRVLMAEHEAVDRKIQSLLVERDQVFSEIARNSGKLN